MRTHCIPALAVAALGLLPLRGEAAIVTQDVNYNAGDTAMIGYLAYDDAIEGRRPGVLVIHEYWGLNDYARRRARELAEMGYVAFAADMYGGGTVAANRQEAGRLAGQVRGTPLMASRGEAALEVLRQQPQTDTDRLAAIGFCFGGTGVLQLAYTGADLDGVVSFHGGLTPPEPEVAERLRAKLLVLHGAADPHVPPTDVQTFLETVSQVGADWQFIAYADAVHAFTNPDAGDDPTTGAAYNANAARRSWQHMQVFFDEIFLTE